MNNKIKVILLVIFLSLLFYLITYTYYWRGNEVSIDLNKINKITITKAGYEKIPYTITDRKYLNQIKESLVLRPFYNITFIDLNPRNADYKITFYQDSGNKKELYYWHENSYLKYNGHNYIPYKDTINLINEKIKSLENNLSPALTLANNGYTDDEKMLIALINLERKRNKLNPYRADLKLSRLARMKSQDMVNLDYTGHNSPTFGTYYDMISAADISFELVGENIVTANTPDNAFDIMIKDRSQKNLILLKEFNKIGVGIIHGEKQESVFTILLIQE